MKPLLSQDLPFKPSKFPINYGWVILISGICGVIMSIPGQTMGVSVFTDYLIDALEIERFELSNAYLIGTLISATLLTRVGKLYDKYGGRVIAMTAALVLSGTLLLLSKSDKIAERIAVQFLGESSSSYVAFGTITVLFFLLRFSGQGVLTMISFHHSKLLPEPELLHSPELLRGPDFLHDLKLLHNCFGVCAHCCSNAVKTPTQNGESCK